MKNLNIGLNDKQRAGSMAELNVALSNASILQIKTKKVHWDIVGPQFMTLHKLLDEQYQTLADYADELAERVRMLGGYPIGTAKGFLELASIQEHPGEVKRATDSIGMLLADQEAIIRHLRGAIERCEETHEDAGTADQLTRMLQGHEQMAWMLRAFIEGESVVPDGKVKLPASATPSLA